MYGCAYGRRWGCKRRLTLHLLAWKKKAAPTEPTKHRSFETDGGKVVQDRAPMRSIWLARLSISPPVHVKILAVWEAPPDTRNTWRESLHPRHALQTPWLLWNGIADSLAHGMLSRRPSLVSKTGMDTPRAGGMHFRSVAFQTGKGCRKRDTTATRHADNAGACADDD